MIKPEDICKLDIEQYSIRQIEKEIDKSIIDYHGWHIWEQAILDEEYPFSVRNIIASHYKDKGWKYVYHKTSSENGERAGLTQFIFSMTELNNDYIKNNFIMYEQKEGEKFK